ncbi:MAG: NHLP bacteriocin system secretion protein [Candidatus Riflebacteria bacterium]|nr:NHLP bacteriocin system secretion protein [Candidatus Riflebacteria bacterium]
MNPFSSSDSIFRKASLDRLASPERTDRLEEIVPPNSWAILAGFFIFISLTVYWGINAKIPSCAQGKGILLTQGGVFNVPSPGSGRLIKIMTAVDQSVKKGNVLAIIEQPELAKEIDAAKQRLFELHERFRQTCDLQQTEKLTQDDVQIKRRSNLLATMETLKSQIKWVSERMKLEENLLAKGLVTRQSVVISQQDIQKLQGQIRDVESQLKLIPAENIQSDNNRTREVISRKTEVAEASRTLELLLKKSEISSVILAPEDGRTLEIMAGEGDLVNQGQPILSLEPHTAGKTSLEAIIYIPLKDGKLVTTGMEVQICPSGVKREEFGFIKGKVISVSQFPASQNGMMTILGNRQLVQALMAEGAPIAARAELLPDCKTPSGYQWSSGKGPELFITSGTLCDISIVVRNQSPVSFVIPKFKELTGL